MIFFEKKVDEEILLLCELDDIKHEVEESKTTTAKIIECISRVDDRLRGSSVISPPIRSATDTPASAQTRLPKLLLPKKCY